MSRHRNIRSMNVHDEYEGYDDVYGHSVEDDYGVSPATEAQFMYRRSEAPRLSSFIEESKKESIEEEEEYDYDDHEDHDHSLSDSQTFQWPRLSDQNEARLRSCLEEIQNVIGDSVPQHVLVDTVMRCDYDLEKALDAVLSIQDKPKEARPMPTAAAPPRTQVSDKDTASDDRSLKIAAHGTSGFSTTDRSQHGISVGKTESSGVLSSSPGLLSTPLSQLSSSPLGLGVGLLSRSTCGSQSNSLPTGASPPHPVSNISHLSGSPQSTLSSLSGVSQLSGSNQARNSSLFGMGQNAGPVKLGGGLSSSQAQSGLPLTMLGSTSSGKLGTVSLSDYQLLGQGFSGGSLDDLGPLGSQTSKTNVVDKKTTSSNEGIGSLNKSGLGSRKDTSIEGNRKGSAALQLPLSSLCSTAGDPSLTSGLLGSTGGMHIDLSAALRKDEPRPLHLSSKTQAKTSSKILPAAQHMSKKVQEFEDRPLSPSFWEQNIFLPKEAISRPSPFAQALCCKECRYIRAGNHPRFTYHHQRKGQRSVSPVQVAQIVPFDFSTPSPDDVVKKKQKAAFTRPNGVG
ncbi:uncharacterized protein LOC118407912 isoform X4 [Branchiostoma floridae]|uniref:Uncharacterized protein LOC118407912 isoform X4 n=1 Tax=Branchiostoma floridae TaxID=7739 RepID=A0A9J7KKR4_BRAFL|nr:uncharacterized protein LOC118407912 isoform X4 [Branchiostoma floridae]